MNGEQVQAGEVEPARADTHEGSPLTDERARKPQWRSWLAAGAVSAVIVAVGLVVLRDTGSGDGTALITSADDGLDSGPGSVRIFGGVAGEVTEVDGSTLSVDSITRSGESRAVTVTTDEGTDVTETVDGDVSDLALGDEVIVVGDETDGAIVAESISEAGGQVIDGGPGDGPFTGEGGPPEDFEPPDDAIIARDLESSDGRGGFTPGTITAIDDAALTIETADGDELSVETTNDTRVAVTETRGVDDIEVGDTIVVTGADGDDADDGIVAADHIQIGDEFGLGRGTFGRPPGDDPEDATDSGDETDSQMEDIRA